MIPAIKYIARNPCLLRFAAEEAFIIFAVEKLPVTSLFGKGTHRSIPICGEETHSKPSKVACGVKASIFNQLV